MDLWTKEEMHKRLNSNGTFRCVTNINELNAVEDIMNIEQLMKNIIEGANEKISEEQKNFNEMLNKLERRTDNQNIKDRLTNINEYGIKLNLQMDYLKRELKQELEKYFEEESLQQMIKRELNAEDIKRFMDQYTDKLKELDDLKKLIENYESNK